MLPIVHCLAVVEVCITCNDIIKLYYILNSIGIFKNSFNWLLPILNIVPCKLLKVSVVMH